jgi:GntR family transcriptional regulator
MVCYISNTPRALPDKDMQSWTDKAPIYQQLADQLAAQLLDGTPPEGEVLPSVRSLASRYLINPLTVSRALQALVDNGLVESRRGLGMYVVAGARQRLLHSERQQFLQKDWPALRAKLKRLGLKATDLNWEEPQ